MTAQPHVLFVDDEPLILGGLRRMLRTHRGRWAMSFAESGAEALETMRALPCDVIVTDYRMPGMDGAELLEQVRREFPGTARVILSGQTNKDNLLRIIVQAHEFLNKPSTPEEIVATVDRLIGVRLVADEALRRDVAFIESLPSAPSTLVALIAAMDADDASAQSVGSVIETDPAAAAKVLHLVNSSAYTAGHLVSNVAQAVALLGLHTVRGLVLIHDLVHTFDGTDRVAVGWLDGLTRHSVESSRLARRLAAGQPWESHAFAAGLLYEIGQLVLASSRPQAYAEVLAAWQGAGTDALAATELAALGSSHIEVGTQLLRLWGLPDQVIEAVAGHGDGNPPGSAADPSSAAALAHLIVEADLGPVCGQCRGVAALDVDQLDEPARNAITTWRRERARQG